MFSLFCKPPFVKASTNPQTEYSLTPPNKSIRNLRTILVCLASLILLALLLVRSIQNPHASTPQVGQIIPKIQIRRLEQNYTTQSRLDEFNTYFNSRSTIIKANATLKTDYKPVTWPQFNSEVPDVDLTAVFITSEPAKYLKKTLISFFSKNTYPLKKVVIINDGPRYPELDQLIKVYPNVTWIITNIKVGQMEAIDQAFKHIETEYYFFSEDDLEYLKEGFIEYCLQALEYDPKLNGLTLAGSKKKDQFVMGPLNIITVIQSPLNSGFTFQPSVHRLKDYRLMTGGFNNASFNVSYGKGAGVCESFISIQYSMKGYHYARSNYQFINHIGAKPSSPIFKPNQNNVNKGYKNTQQQFQAYLKQHKDPKKEKAALSYLLEKQKASQSDTSSQKEKATAQINTKIEQKNADKIQKELNQTKIKLKENQKELENLNKKIKDLQSNNKQQENKLKQFEKSKQKQQQSKKKLEIELKKNIEELRVENKKLSDESLKTQQIVQSLDAIGKHNKQLQSKLAQPVKLQGQNSSQEPELKAKQIELFSKMLEKEVSYYRTQRNILAAMLLIFAVGTILLVVWKYCQKRSRIKQEQISGVKVVQVEQI